MEQQQKRAKPYKLIIACIMLVGFVAVGAVVAYKWQPIMHKVRRQIEERRVGKGYTLSLHDALPICRQKPKLD